MAAAGPGKNTGGGWAVRGEGVVGTGGSERGEGARRPTLHQDDEGVGISRGLHVTRRPYYPMVRPIGHLTYIHTPPPLITIPY